mmetsp:Transcript_50897/g.146894  ORF Transcript_50897/g.146894 Transcript_50897/m.146894 type:complete len:407 (+) Transcript_50897:32-1252(+)
MAPLCVFYQVRTALGDISLRSFSGLSNVRHGDISSDDHPVPMRRSNSLASKFSKCSNSGSEALSKPIFRRSQSAHSALSALSAKTEQSSTSAPPHVEIAPIRPQNSLRIVRDPAHNVFEFVDKLGQGGFGEVWRATRKHADGEAFAIKLIPCGGNQEQVARLQELKVFERLTHPYIVRLHEVFLDEEYLYLVMDECTGGNLVRYMETFVDDPQRIIRKFERPDYVRGLPAGIIGHLLWQMLVGIAYMHHHRFCHRDVKLDNFMIKEPAKQPVLQLVDFGMAVRFKKGGSICGTVGTIKYMAPEVVMGTYNEKCDIWAIGIVCYILCMDVSPWGQHKTKGELIESILEERDQRLPPCDKPNALRKLVDRMLTRKSQARPSAKELLKSSKWLRQHAQQAQRAPCCIVS